MDAGTVTTRQSMNSWSIAAFGAFGGLLPTIVRLFELLDKPDATRPTLAGYLSIDTLIIVVAYVGSAAVLATIFPYPRKPSPWLATSVGVAMPTLVGGMASAAKYLGPAALTFRGGEDSTHISWQSLLNLLAIF